MKSERLYTPIRKLLAWILVYSLLLISCQANPVGSVDATSALQITSTIQPVESNDTHLPIIMSAGTQAMTYHQTDGNRVLEGQGQLPQVEPLDIILSGTPTWVVATPTMTGILWAVTLADGSVQVFEVADRTLTEVTVSPSQLPVGAPPMLYVSNGRPHLLVPNVSSSEPTHAVFVNDGSHIAYIEPDGDLTVQSDSQTTTLAVDALLDARILVDELGRLLLLSGPTDRYAHGVLGDRIEASGITLVETKPSPQIVRSIVIPAPDVIEGIAPIWVDFDGDGQREIIVTHSNANVGAWIAVYSEAGDLLATGPAIGRGSRWRHQLAVAAFGLGGQMELVDVLTPHIGGMVEFYQWQENQLTLLPVSRATPHTSSAPVI